MQTLGLSDISESFLELKKSTANILPFIDKIPLKLVPKISFKDSIKMYHQFVFCNISGKLLADNNLTLEI